MRLAKSPLVLMAALCLPLSQLRAEDKPAPAGIAHIRLSGDLDETPVATDAPLGNAENLRMVLDRIAKAAKDPKIRALYLEIDDLSIGFGKLAEVQRAIADFRKSGKKVYAYCEDAGTKEYLTALSCDVAAMPESGTLMLVGLRASVTFFKGALDLLKLKAEVLKVGDYKGAVEPFVREDLSKENREQIESMLDDHFDHDLVDAMIAARPQRKWSIDAVRKLIDGGPYTAKQAADAGLIDRVAYSESLVDQIKKNLKAEKIQMQENYARPKKEEMDLGPLGLLKLLSPAKPKESKAPKIAVIYAVGAIESGKGGGNPLSGDSVGSTSMIEAIRQAEKDATVKAIVLRVDSPGGSALASDLIWNELVRCQKPVVASMGDVAASGGYYISMACRKIYAEPGTITGSIGVFGLKLVTGGLTSWAGMKSVTIQRGQNAGIATSERGYTESERTALTKIIKTTYDQFIDKALAGRQKAGAKLDRGKLLSLAGGRVWTGRQAKERGLVDELGTLDDAIGEAKQMAGIERTKQMELLILPRPTSFLDRLLDGDLKSPLGLSLELPGVRETIRQVGPLLRSKDTIKAMLPYKIAVK